MDIRVRNENGVEVHMCSFLHFACYVFYNVIREKRFKTNYTEEVEVAMLWKCQSRAYIFNCFFYDGMTVHRDKFLMNKTNRRTEFQFYWYYDSTCFGQSLRLSSGVLSRTSALVHFMQLWWPFVTRSRTLLLVTNGHHNCIKCTNVDVWLKTHDDRRKDCPKHVES